MAEGKANGAAAGMTVTAGNQRRVQARKERKDGFSAAKRQVFLDHLAACCNVTLAAAAVGVSTVTVNYHRRRDPAFAQQFEEALTIGYGNLEAMLIERAAHGAGYTPGSEAAAAPGVEAMDTMLGLHLLRLRHRPAGQRTGRAGYAPKAAGLREVTESILAKLDVLERRVSLKRHAVRKLKSRAAVAEAAGTAKPVAPRGRDDDQG